MHIVESPAVRVDHSDYDIITANNVAQKLLSRPFDEHVNLTINGELSSARVYLSEGGNGFIYLTDDLRFVGIGYIGDNKSDFIFVTAYQLQYR